MTDRACRSVYTLDGFRVSVYCNSDFAYLESIDRGHIAYEDVGVSKNKYDEEQKLFMHASAEHGVWHTVNPSSISGKLYVHQLFVEPEDGPIIGYTIEQIKELSRQRETRGRIDEMDDFCYALEAALKG